MVLYYKMLWLWLGLGGFILDQARTQLLHKRRRKKARDRGFCIQADDGLHMPNPPTK